MKPPDSDFDFESFMLLLQKGEVAVCTNIPHKRI